jgi:hypothetical protein
MQEPIKLSMICVKVLFHAASCFECPQARSFEAGMSQCCVTFADTSHYGTRADERKIFGGGITLPQILNTVMLRDVGCSQK